MITCFFSFPIIILHLRFFKFFLIFKYPFFLFDISILYTFASITLIVVSKTNNPFTFSHFHLWNIFSTVHLPLADSFEKTTLIETNYIACNLKPLSFLSFKDNILPSFIDVKMLLFVWDNWGFLFLDATAPDMRGIAICNRGLTNSFYAVWSVSKKFCNVFLKQLPSNWNCIGVNVTCIWRLHFRFWQIPCNLTKSPLRSILQQAALDTGDFCFFSQNLFFFVLWYVYSFININ